MDWIEGSMTNLLEMRNVSQIFGDVDKGGTVAVENLSYTIPADAASFTAVVGESGSGKTTIARILLGFQQPTHGQVLYRGHDLATAPRNVSNQFRREVQAVFQDPFEVYNPFYKVDHLLEVPIRKFRLASGRAETRRLMEEAVSRVGLRPDETLGRYPHQLSGGQRQRITVARAILLKPRLIVADEPVSMVDASLRATILQTLRSLNEELGISFVYITHDLTTAYQVSDNILVLYRGRIAEAGAVEPVIKRPHHPYTRLLVGSIPMPDPNRRWGEDVVAATTDETVSSRLGCTFAARCPYVMEQCRGTVPPLYRLESRRASACFLAPQAEGELPLVEGDITQVFAPTERLLNVVNPAGGQAAASRIEKEVDDVAERTG
jgi:peptide/nickel transport system ATP-binding protein